MLWEVLFRLRTHLFYKKISKLSVFGLLPLPAFFNWGKKKNKKNLKELERLTATSHSFVTKSRFEEGSLELS